ncbi:MAG: hypothetical protein ACKVOX_06720 [Rhizobacter sp.]
MSSHPPKRPLPPIPSRPPNRPLPAIPDFLNDETRLLRDRPLDLFRKFAVSPPDGAVGDLVTDTLGMGSARRSRVMPLSGRRNIDMDGTFSRFFKPGMGSIGEGFSHAEVNQKIAWIRLERMEVRPGALTFQAVIPSGPDKVPRGYLPVWFLPWESRHLIEMTIPPRSNDDDDDPEDPKLFFTAGINGCSVFVRGDPTSPTITHAGITQSQTPYGNDPASFWRHLLFANLAGQNVHSGKTWEVNNTNYINQTGVSGGAFTANTDRYLKWLQSLPSGPITVTQVDPWGCVFGIRYGRLWSFYLQENAVVHTYKIVSKYSTEQVTSTKKVMGLYNKEVTQDVAIKKLVRLQSTANRPVRLSDFFPGKGGSQVNFIDKWQRF